MRYDLLPYDAELDAATTTGDSNTATRDGSTEEQLRAAKRQRPNAKDGVMGVGWPRRVGTIPGVSNVNLFKRRWLSHFIYSKVASWLLKVITKVATIATKATIKDGGRNAPALVCVYMKCIHSCMLCYACVCVGVCDEELAV